MMQFKDANTCYTDTDSIFTTKSLNPILVGKELGQMKDEMDGIVIQKACFLGLKQYGYQYLDKDNNLITKSVFAGIERDSLSYEEILDLSKGKKLTKTVENRFYKSFNNLEIKIVSKLEITVQQTKLKQLVSNNYIPITLKDFNYNKDLSLIKKIKNSIT